MTHIFHSIYQFYVGFEGDFQIIDNLDCELNVIKGAIFLCLALNHNDARQRRGRVVSTHASYSGGPGFESRPGHRLS
jgi:hypothetical protein